MGVSDDYMTFINIDGSINPIGEKTSKEYFNYLVSSCGDAQAHGIGAFDIKYSLIKVINYYYKFV